MSFSYCLLVITFLVLPVFAFLCSRQVQSPLIGKILKYSFAFFLLYDLAFYYGYSIKGDYPDYIIFSLQYFWFCTLIFSIKWNALWRKILKIAGCLLVGLGYVIGLVGILIFIMISTDMESDRQFHFSKNRKHYEVRAFSNPGWVGSGYTYYTFDVYNSFGPVEYRLISCRFSDEQSNLNFAGNLQFSVIDSIKKQYLVITDDKDTRLICPSR